MNTIFTVLTLLVLVPMVEAAPPDVALSDYAFDFTTVGYEIAVTGQSFYISDELDAQDYLDLRDGGYTIKTVIDGLSRQSRKEFIRYYNKHCQASLFRGSKCLLRVSGEVALDDNMKMFLTADEIWVCQNDCSEIVAVFQ